MAKFDLEKYWDFRVWVKSQIAQLRKAISEYQQNGGGGGTGGGSGSSDFNPAGTYPNLTAGKATKADTATRATNADKATKATSATTAESAKTAMNADSATTAGYATTAGVAESTEHATTADFATDLTGRIEATPEVFTYRPSAGEQSIKDDNAFIRAIKGNSVVWNQFIAQYYRTTNGVTISFENGIYNLSGAASDSYFQIAYITDMPKGHLFLLFCEVLANPNNIPFTFGDLNNYGSYFGGFTMTGGTISNHKGVNVPNVHLDFPHLSEQDEADLRFGVEQNVDFVAASFVSQKQDIADMRQFMNEHGGAEIDIIAKDGEYLVFIEVKYRKNDCFGLYIILASSSLYVLFSYIVSFYCCLFYHLPPSGMPFGAP